MVRLTAAVSSPSRRSISPADQDFPSKAELLGALPEELLRHDPLKSWGSLALSLGLSLLAYGLGTLIPLSWAALPLWLVYGLGTGTVAMGCWVLAHECGHNAFHPNRRVEGVVGFVLHSLLLVPYYCWARSHAVHHAYCNELERGQTHVPPRASSSMGLFTEGLTRKLGRPMAGLVALFNHVVIGWPLYLLFGVTGGEAYGSSVSHFRMPEQGVPLKRPLFPAAFRRWMLRSNIGLVVVLGALVVAAIQFSPLRVLAVYGLPYLVVNGWLVVYTWLQHTDVEIPHYDSQHWTWVKGALQTVDRPYGPLINLLHHGIGSTHVCHHVNSAIPHYNAWRGTALLRQRYPQLVRFDPTPIHKALWRVATRCKAVRQSPVDGAFYF